MMSRLARGAVALVLFTLCGCSSPTPAAKTNPCPNGFETDGGQCVECRTTADCTGGTFCNASGVCEGCAQAPASCSADGGLPNHSCSKDTDCPRGDYCDSYVCKAGCSMDSECETGQTCKNNQCAAGCTTDSNCGGLSCCSGMCVDTMSDPNENCGGCGNAACTATNADDNACCNGKCADTMTDPDNCGTCGTKCGGTIQCKAGMCQNGYGILGLFDVTGNAKVGGTTTQEEVLTSFVQIIAGNPPTSNLQALLSGPVCTAIHYDSSTPLTPELDAGDITISGYTGGTFVAGGTAPSQIECALEMGTTYLCGYGSLNMGMPGPAPGEQAFAPMTNALGTGTVAFNAPGGTSFGSFMINSTATTGLPVAVDLSTLTYSASADTTFMITCPMSGCPVSGYFALVRATSNAAAHFEEPASAGGAIACIGAFGTFMGFALGPPQVTFKSSDIATMLGSDASTITTFATSVVTIPESALTGLTNTTDSEGHHVIAIAGTGSFGLSAAQ
jgi:hypothetical protein